LCAALIKTIKGTEWEEFVFPKLKTEKEKAEGERSELFISGIWSFTANKPGPRFRKEHVSKINRLGGKCDFEKAKNFMFSFYTLKEIGVSGMEDL
jgi:hypothetical protein